MPKKYIVYVVRTSFAGRDIEVEAENADEAMTLAQDIAGDFEFSENDVEYEAQYVCSEEYK